MLMEMLFSMVFFLLPIIGMFVAILARAMQQEESSKKETIHRIGRRKVRPKVASPLVDHPVMRYQLIESKIQVPLRFSSHKRLFHQRAGP